MLLKSNQKNLKHCGIDVFLLPIRFDHSNAEINCIWRGWTFSLSQAAAAGAVLCVTAVLPPLILRVHSQNPQDCHDENTTNSRPILYNFIIGKKGANISICFELKKIISHTGIKTLHSK